MRNESDKPWLERHRTVMPKEVLEFMKVNSGGSYLDVTFGEGGHSEAMLAAGASRVIGLDRDLETLDRYREGGALRKDPRLTLAHGRFSELSKVLSREGLPSQFDGAIADLGVSTRQILDPERGFSFRGDGPIDMRMDTTAEETLIAKLLSCEERELMNALRDYGDVRGAPRIARQLKEKARAGTLRTTGDIVSLTSGGDGTRHPATQLFMALRIWLNDEMGEVREGLPHLVSLLKPGGRLVVLSFHSTEDRAVKHAFQLLSGKCICGETYCMCPRVKAVSLVNPKPLEPTTEECRANPRARSAKLRCVEKLVALP